DLDGSPIFSPDGKTVAYSNRDANAISRVPADNSKKSEELLRGQNPSPNDWSRDGRYLVYMNLQRGFPGLYVYNFQEKQSRRAYAAGAEAQFSPDGRWLSFTGPGGSEASSFQDSDVFVVPFPGPGPRIQISDHGGAQARWRADGKEIFYLTADKKLMAV